MEQCRYLLVLGTVRGLIKSRVFLVRCQRKSPWTPTSLHHKFPSILLLDMITHLMQLAPLLVLLKTHGTPYKMLTCFSRTCLTGKKCHLGNAKFFALAETCDLKGKPNTQIMKAADTSKN